MYNKIQCIPNNILFWQVPLISFYKAHIAARQTGNNLINFTPNHDGIEHVIIYATHYMI